MSAGFFGLAVLEPLAHPDQALLVAHLLDEVGQQPRDGVALRLLALGQGAQLEHHLVDGAVVVLDEHGVQQLDEDLLQQRHVIHAAFHHLEDGAHQLGEEARVLLLLDLLLELRLQRVRGVRALHHHAADLLHALQLRVQILRGHAREAQVVLRVRPQAGVEVAHHLVHLDGHLLVGGCRPWRSPPPPRTRRAPGLPSTAGRARRPRRAPAPRARSG